MRIVEADRLIRYAHAPCRSAELFLGRTLGLCEPAAGACVDDASVAGVRRFGGMQLAAAAEAGVDEVCLPELIEVVRINIAASALKIGIAVCADVRALVPCQSQPFQLTRQCIGLGEAAALGVEVFDAQDDFAAALFGVEPCQQAAEDVAQMQKAAGRGREAPD